MINKTFEGNKYRRTYIGGSKEKEKEIFLKVQGTKEDNSDCDWFEYRRILIQYFDDVLHVMISWEQLLQIISIIILMFSVLLIKIPLIFLILFGISVLLQIIRYRLKINQKRSLHFYNMCLTLTLNEIEKLSGLKLNK